MKKKVWMAAVAVLGLTAVTQAGVVYNNDFSTATTLAEAGLQSAGASGGLWKLDTANDRLNAAFPGGNDRATVKNTGGWQSDGGFTLDVTFNQLGAGTRFTIGLVDASASWNQGNDFLNSSATYSIGFTSDGELENDNGNKDLLGFNNATTKSKLSDAQGDITYGELSTLSLTVTSTGWSYSLNGAEATTGSLTFDTSKSYKFVAFGQNSPMNGSYISNVTLTSIPEPATMGMVVAFGGGILFIRRLLQMG